MRRLLLGLALFLVGSQAASAQPEDHRFSGKVVLFGTLHAHSSLSDDAARLPDNAGVDFSPGVLFAYARDHGLDFLGVSDHQQATDANHRLSLTEEEYKKDLYDVAMTFTADHPGFVAIPGVEWGTEGLGNHVNIFGSKTLPPDTILNAEYEKLYAWGATNALFANFNHPNGWKKTAGNTVGNYGEGRFSDSKKFTTAANKVVRTISIITTVPGGHLTGAFATSEEKIHRAMQWENFYQKYLNMGFHLAPSANQDTHRKNPGTVTAARTAVWSSSATLDALTQAIKANRVYATEDDELAVAYRVTYHGATYWMGDTVPLGVSAADVTLKVKVWQVAGVDDDSTDEGPYTVDLVSDPDGPGPHRASIWKSYTTEADGTLSVIVPVLAGEYCYLVITEQNGKDNAKGEGVDEIDNETGEPHADGKRDDMNDRAWTAPIWFKR
jgi:hypothetical protein